MLPNFLIIGAPRSGTTWLAKNLMEHPEIFLPLCKEPRFFNRHYDRGLAWYEALFDDAKGAIAIGDATPDYLASVEAPGRIRRDLGDVNLIVVLRNPVDRLYSRHCNAKGKFRDQQNISFEQRIEENPHLVREGFYFEHIDRFLRFFPRERIHIDFYENLKRQPREFLSEIFSFLGVNDHFETAAAEHVLNAAHAKPLNARIPLLYWVQRAARRIGMARLSERIDRFNRHDTPPMNPETRARLIADFYHDQNNRLGDLLNIDLSHWN